MSFDQITKIGGDYWERRALKLELLTQEKAGDAAQVICESYNQAQRSIVKQIEAIFARYAHNKETLNDAKALRLLSAKQTAEYRQALWELYNGTDNPGIRSEIRARLDAPAYANRISRLQALRDRVYADCRMLGMIEVALVRDQLMDVLEQAYCRQTFDLQQGTGRYYDFSRLSNRQMQTIVAQKWEGGNYSSRIWDNNKQFAEAVERTIATGILSGQSYRDMSDNLRRIIGTYNSEGAKYKSMRLIRTECAHVAAQGQLLGCEAGGVERYIFLATLDLVTSEICRSLDMKRFPLTEAKAGVNLPPMHPNCRSTTMPEVDESVLKKIRRAARDPATGKSVTVPGDMSYREWYKKYVAGNQEAEANEKKVKNESGDQKQFEQYRAALGDHAPKSLASFQRIKYNEPEEWASLKDTYREVNWQRQAQQNGITSGSVHKVPIESAPNTVFDNYKDGVLESRRYYGKNGRPRLDIDMTDHRNPKKHPVVPHRHSWAELDGRCVKRSTNHDEELTTGEKIANADILEGGDSYERCKTDKS